MSHITEEPLWHRVALLHTELECDGGRTAGQADGTDVEDIEADLEAQVILYNDDFLRDKCDDDAQHKASR